MREGPAVALGRLLAALTLTIAAVAGWALPAAAAPGDISTVAGDGTFGSSGDGGSATAASLGSPEGVFFSGVGLHLMEDAGPRLRHVNLAGTISTVAGGGLSDPGDGGPATDVLLPDPEQVIRDRAGNLYFSAGHRIRRVSTLGIITTVAGTGTAGFSGDGGPATAAQIARPHGLALDLNGNLYFGDCDNHRIRRVSQLGVITTVAGSGSVGYSGDGGPATAAAMSCPADVIVDQWGRLFIASNDNNVVRQVDLGTGLISTFAGTGAAGHTGDGGPATAATMRGPQGLAVDGAGSVYVSEAHNHIVRKVAPNGTISTVVGIATGAGSENSGVFSGDGGPATLAELNGPRDIAFDHPTGDLYIADRYNNRIRQVDALGAPDLPPTVNIGSSPGAAGTDDTPTWTFSAGGTQQVGFECRLTRGAVVVSDWTTCTSPRTYDLSAQPDGSYTFQVRSVTVSGEGAPTSSSYALESADHFEFDAIPDPTSGDAFNVTVRAKTASGLTDTSFNGTVTFSTNAGSISPTTSGSFVNGVLTQSVVLSGAYSAGRTITATSGSPAINGTSAAFTLHDGKYYFKQTTANIGTNCGAAWARRDMEEGYTGQDPEETHTRYTGGAERINFCGPAITVADSLAPGTAQVHAYVNNVHGSTCNISATLLKNGTVSLGSAIRTIPPQIPVTLFTWTINTSATTLAVGDRLNLRLEMQPVQACNRSDIHYGGTVYRSHLELFAGSEAPLITGGPGQAGSDPTPTWSFAGEAGASFECRLEDEAGQPIAGFDWASCTSPKTFDITALPDGPYAFAVRQTVSGITSPSARSDYLLDRVDPAAPAIGTSPPSPGTATSVSWTFSGEDGASFECRLRKGALVVSDWAPCTDSQGYNLVDGDGNYTFEVRQTDEAGNLGPTTTRDYELDTAVPSPPAIVLSPPTPGADETPTWGFVGETSALLECRLTRGATVVSDWAGCLSPRTYDLSGEPDGSYTFSVRQTDLAGNVSAPTTSAYELDSAASGAPTIDGGAPATGNDPTPTWSFSGEAGGAFSCRIEDAGGQPVAGYDWGACTSPATFDLSGEPDGTYTFLVRHTDAAGNTSPAATRGYVLDTNAPGTPSFDSTPGAGGSATNPSWSFSGEAGASFECRLERGGTLVSDWAACTSPHALDLSAEPDGLYTLSVRAVDAAGNRSSAVGDDYALDRLSPGAPSLTGTPGAVGNDATPTWSFTGEAGALLECRLERGGALVEDWQTCTSPRTYDLSSAPDGDYSFLVRATDSAGNVGPETESVYELDRLAPSVPTIDSGPGSLGNNRAPTWTFTGDLDAVHECRLTRNGQVVDDWAPCAGTSGHDLTGEPDGTYVFEVRGRDDAGNVGAAASSLYQLDTVGADVTIESGPAPLGNSSNPVWSFVGEPGASFQCRLEHSSGVLSDWAGCTSPHGYDLSSTPDGSHTFFVRSADGAGNVGDPVAYTFELDRAAPAAPVFTVAPPALANDTSPRWEFAAEAGAVAECGLAREGTLAAWEPCAGGRSYDLTTQGDGNYELMVRVTDGAGNVSPTSGSAYRLDATAPDAPRITSGPGARGRQHRVAWAFTGEAGAAFDCRLARGATVLDAWAPCGSPSDFSLAGSNPGDHTFSVRATDAAGNRGSTARSDYELLAPAEPEEPKKKEPKKERESPSEDGGAPPADGPSGPSAPAPASEPAPAPVGAAPAPADDEGSGRRRRNRGDGDGRGAGIPIDPDRDEVAPLDFSDRWGEEPKSLGERLLEALGEAAVWTGRNLDKTAFPLALLLLVLGYLGLQNRMDRRDPKLALAPVHADSTLEFLPPPSLREGGGPGQWADSTT